MRFAFWLLLFIFTCLSSCSLIRHNPKYTFADGQYTSKAIDKDIRKVYVDYEEETIYVYPLRKTTTGFTMDTATHKPQVFGESRPGAADALHTFRQNSFDVDFLTMPFKYRFPAEGFPRQFTTNLNGAVYLGYRSDIYVLHYSNNLLGKSARSITHAGFSFGAFTGVGGTAMNPWVTNNQIGIEYDGMVWSKGVAGIIGLNNFTTGLALGWDHLLDRNRKSWLYQQKPWIGFVFGLNLN